MSSLQGTDSIAVGATHGTQTNLITSDPERVELKLHAFSVRTLLLVTDPWALPTPIKFHTCGVKAVLDTGALPTAIQFHACGVSTRRRRPREGTN